MNNLLELPQQFNAATYFLDRNVEEGRGEKAAIHYQDLTLTYRQVQELVNRTGNALRSLDVRMENRVLIMLLDCPEFAATFFGAMKIGAVPIPVNTNMCPKDYEYFLNDSRAVALVINEPLLGMLEEIKENLKYLRHIIVVGQPRPGQLSFAEITTKSSPDLAAANTSKDDAAFWLYSSGTTGFPKGAVHLHHDMVYCACLYAQNVLGITEKDTCFSVAKLFFAYGLGNGLYFPFSVGAATVLYPGRPEPASIFEVIDRYRPTIFYGVPTAFNSMLQVPDAEKKYALSSIRVCTSAGEALPKIVYERWLDRFGSVILDGIGSTEILHIFISNRLGDVRPGSSGRLVEGYGARIVDEEGRPVPQGEVGTLLIKGDSTAAYYWNKHEKNKSTMLGEWINTGDRYYQDEEGYFWYVGRADDMIKAGGIWVSPVEVENTLLEHPAVLECGVVGAPDKDDLIKPLAYVVLKPEIQPSADLEEELKQFVKNKIAPYKYPRWIKFIPELPKTATGKTQRYKLRQSK